MAKYLIIGSSAGGIGAVEAIREVDPEGDLALLSEEPYLAYSRPAIAEYLTGEKSQEKILFRPQDFYAHHRVEVILGRKALRLDLGQRLVHLADGEALPWEKLLLATGGRPFLPKTEGLDLDREGVFTFTTLDEAKKIAAFLDRDTGSSRKAVVIGGGLIGASVSGALVHRGVAVTMVEMKEKILNTILDEEGSTLAEEVFTRAGVQVLTAHTVARVQGRKDRAVSGVVLDDGRELPCDLVVVAIGVVPRTELVAGTQIAVNRGILVDRHLETSVPGVYACGDVAESFDFMWGTRRLNPIWPKAY
ncbi:MAG: FAD-dependent oxidoreductase [Chloroflexota bacterium]|nr:FAD-dependent oxidoreductase [Chloroflexota bacterium]